MTGLTVSSAEPKPAITRGGALQIEALVLLAKKHQAIVDDCLEEMLDILGQHGDLDFVRDMVHADISVASGLARMGIEVEG